MLRAEALEIGKRLEMSGDALAVLSLVIARIDNPDVLTNIGRGSNVNMHFSVTFAFLCEVH